MASLTVSPILLVTPPIQMLGDGGVEPTDLE